MSMWSDHLVGGCLRPRHDDCGVFEQGTPSNGILVQCYRDVWNA